MFSVVIPISELTDLVLNNARLLSTNHSVKQIILLNISSDMIELNNRIPKTEIIHMFDDEVYNAISKIIEEQVNQPNVILLDNNIQINKKFMEKLVSHYAQHHLYTFKTNVIKSNKSIVTDTRLGNTLTPEMFYHCALAFGRQDAIDVDSFKENSLINFVYKMMNKGCKLQLLNRVLCHVVDSEYGIIKEVIETAETIEAEPLADTPPKIERSVEFNWALESDYKHPQLKFKYIPNKSKGKVKYSFILPFMYKGDRWPLFEATIRRLHKLTKNKNDIEIIVHETSERRFISDDFVKNYNLVYIYNEIDILFHRAWNLNVASRYVAKGDFLIFMDGDLLIDDNWLKELYKCKLDECYVGWSVIKNFTEAGTNEYLRSGKQPNRFSRIRTFISPEKGAAAGINIFPKEIFENLGGWPECFGRFGYGGEDNSLYMKMSKFGYKYKTINAIIYHLHHSHKTPGMFAKEYSKIPINTAIVKNQHRMRKVDWVYHTLLERNYNWGYCEKMEELFPSSFDNPTLMYMFKQTVQPLITICMVTYRRTDTLLKTINNYKKLGIKLNLVLWINDSESMSREFYNTLETLCDETFVKVKIFKSKENVGTAKSRNRMLKFARKTFDTEYIMTTDDDILFNSADSIIVSAVVLQQKQYKKYGACGIGCEPASSIIKIVGKKMYPVEPVNGVQDVDVLGAASMMIRKSVLKVCNVDDQYPRMGLVDWDFSLTITSSEYGDWSLGYIHDKRYRVVNDAYTGDAEYQQNRYYKPFIKKAYEIFTSKWDVEPIIAEHWKT